MPIYCFKRFRSGNIIVYMGIAQDDRSVAELETVSVHAHNNQK